MYICMLGVGVRAGRRGAVEKQQRSERVKRVFIVACACSEMVVRAQVVDM